MKEFLQHEAVDLLFGRAFNVRRLCLRFGFVNLANTSWKVAFMHLWLFAEHQNKEPTKDQASCQ